MRAEVESAPLTLMISFISDDGARKHLLEGGAVDFLIKLYLSTDVFRVLSDGLVRLNQPPFLRINLLLLTTNEQLFNYW